MNEVRDKARFKCSLEKLIKGFVETMNPTAPVPYLGADTVDPLEHTTRADFIDTLLSALGWDVKTKGGAVIEEARIKEETTLFLDYLGVNPDTRAPLVIVEAKAWSKPTVAPSATALAQENRNVAYTKESLIAAAVDHCKKGGQPDTSPVTAEWAKWIAQVSGYVLGVHEKTGHIVHRCVVTSGQWLVVFIDPENAFFGTDGVDPTRILIFALSDFVVRSDEIFDLLAYARLSEALPAFISPYRLHAYATSSAVKSLFRALWIKRQEGGAHFRVRPQLHLYAAAVIERSDGLLVTILDEETENSIPHDLDDLRDHIEDVQAASDDLLAAIQEEIGTLPEPSGVAMFPGFAAPPTIGAIGGAAAPRTGREKRFLKSWPVRADEFLLVTGASAHFFRLEPTVAPCGGHDWVVCQSLGLNKGEGPVIARSVQPVSFFMSGESHHCAHRIVHDRREERCQISAFEEYLCCRVCEYQGLCWSGQEIGRLPCGIAQSAGGNPVSQEGTLVIEAQSAGS